MAEGKGNREMNITWNGKEISGHVEIDVSKYLGEPITGHLTNADMEIEIDYDNLWLSCNRCGKMFAAADYIAGKLHLCIPVNQSGMN